MSDNKPREQPAVSIMDLGVRYDDTLVLDRLNLTVQPGEVHAVVGRSGTGKTSLLKAICNLVPYRGSIITSGRVRMVFQDALLLPWLSVRRNVEIGYCRHGSNVPEDAALYVSELMERMGVGGLGNKYPDELSGGQKQRVALARTFAGFPDVVCMDEPFGALDVLTREHMHLWLGEVLAELGITVILVTHSIEEALILCDRLSVIRDGRLWHVADVPLPRPRTGEMKTASWFLKAMDNTREAIFRQ